MSRRRGLTAAGAAGWLMADLMLVVSAVAIADAQPPKNPTSVPSASASLTSRPSATATPKPSLSPSPAKPGQQPGINVSTKHKTATVSKKRKGSNRAAYDKLAKKILAGNPGVDHGRPGLVLVFGVGWNKTDGQEAVAKPAVEYLRTFPKLKGAAFDYYMQLPTDTYSPGDMYAIVYYYDS